MLFEHVLVVLVCRENVTIGTILHYCLETLITFRSTLYLL